MKSLLAFWKKDIINKLIILVTLALAGGLLTFTWFAFHMPEGKSISDAIADFLPVQATPTFDINTYFTPGAETPAAQIPTPTPATNPTFIVPSPAPTLDLPSPTLELPTPTLEVATLTPIQPPSTTLGSACIPNNPQQTGVVVEVLDGNTIRVLMEDKLVHVVRYIGVSAPTDTIYGNLAEQKNIELVYGKDKVTLIKDRSDKDERGRLLRYVLVHDTFINLEMLQQGLGSAFDVPPDSACAQVFASAEQASRTAQLGKWKPSPTP
mgnify:CR=1 FL=1